MDMNLTSIAPTINEIKRSLHELYGDRLVKLILFGSHARGEANPDSDIDLLAVFKSPISQVQEIVRNQVRIGMREREEGSIKAWQKKSNTERPCALQV